MVMLPVLQRRSGDAWILISRCVCRCVSLTCPPTTLRWQTATVSVGSTRTTTRGSVPVSVQLLTRAGVQHSTTSRRHTTTGLPLIARQRSSVVHTTFPSQWRFNRVRDATVATLVYASPQNTVVYKK